MRCDYTTVGHVTLDVMADGSRRPGGSAFYSALQAARLGKRAKIITRGVPDEIQTLLAPYSEEFELEVQDAPCTTSLATRGKGLAREQRMLAWAGPIELTDELDTEILHFAPIAREIGDVWRGRAGFLGLTPQGLARMWSAADPRIVLAPPRSSPLFERCAAIVISEAERTSCEGLLRDRAGEAIAVVTDAAAPTELQLPGGEQVRLPVPPVSPIRDDMGAGDVFAAAFFIALAEGEQPIRAAGFATAAAAVRVAGEGPAAVGERAAIEARVAAVA